MREIASTILSSEADLIVGRMVERCNRLGTKCTVDKGRVSIPVFRQ